MKCLFLSFVRNILSILIHFILYMYICDMENTQLSIRLTDETYHLDIDYASKSGLDLMHEAPIKFYYERIDPNAPKLDTLALKQGRFFHTYFLEREQLEKRFLIVDEEAKLTEIGGAKPRGTNAYRDWISEVENEANMQGKTVVFKSLEQQAEIMGKAMGKNKLANAIMSQSGTCEAILQWERGEFKCKAKYDKVITEFNYPEIPELHGCFLIADYKTCVSANPIDFVKHIHAYRYDIQAAHYINGIECTGANQGKTIKFVFIAQEKKFPFLTEVFILSDEDLERADDELLADLGKYHSVINEWKSTESIETFGGYTDGGLNVAFLPSWDR